MALGKDFEDVRESRKEIQIMNVPGHAVALLGLFLAGCQNIPSNTPILLEKNNERLEIQATTVAAAFQTTIDEITFIKDDVTEAKQLLLEIDSEKLTEADQKKLSDSIQLMDTIESSLTIDPKIQNRPAVFKNASKEILAIYNLIQTILAEHGDQQALINGLIENIKKEENQ